MKSKIENNFTRLVGVRYPIICAPMFLVSNVEMMVAVAEAGALGVFPSLNFRPPEAFREAIRAIRSRTSQPFGVNMIVNKSNPRLKTDLDICIEEKVPFFITSLGSPQMVIEKTKANGALVFCDVINLEHALKAQALGAHGVIAVSSGAGGHAGPLSPLVLVPWLKKQLKIPVVAAGGIASGRGLVASLALGAEAVSVGTRFIASKEAEVTSDYKEAIMNATPEDIMMTTRLTGTPAAVIKTEYTKNWGPDLPWLIEQLKKHPKTKQYVVPILHWLGSRSLEAAAAKPTWKTVWSAGQSVGLIDDVKTCRQIIEAFVKEYAETVQHLPRVQE